MTQTPRCIPLEPLEREQFEKATRVFQEYFIVRRDSMELALFKASLWLLGILATLFLLFRADFAFAIVTLILGVILCFLVMLWYPSWKVRHDFYKEFPEHAKWL